MNKITLFLSCLFCLFSANAQLIGKKDIIATLKNTEKQYKGDVFYVNGRGYNAEEKFGEIVKGDIQYTFHFSFTKEGRLTGHFIDNDDVLNAEDFYYDENKLLTSFTYTTIDKRDNSTVVTKYICKYNDNNNLSEIINTSDNTRLVFEYEAGKRKSITEYDKDNNLTNKIVLKHISNIEYDEIWYDNTGKQIAVTKYKNNLPIRVEEGSTVTTCKYNANKKLVEKTNSIKAPAGARATYNGKDIGNSINSIFKHAYDNNGNQISESAIVQGINVITINSEYTYDKKQNWTRKINSTKEYNSSNIKLSLEECDVEYYSTAQSDSIPDAYLKYYDNRNYKTDLPDRLMDGHDFADFAQQLQKYFKEKNIAVYRLFKNDESVVVSFVINRNGNLREVKILQGVSENTDKIILEAVKSTKFSEPAIQNGEFISIQYSLPINANTIFYGWDL